MNTRLCDGCHKPTAMENLKLIRVRDGNLYFPPIHKLVCKKCVSNYIGVRIA